MIEPRDRPPSERWREVDREIDTLFALDESAWEAHLLALEARDAALAGAVRSALADSTGDLGVAQGFGSLLDSALETAVRRPARKGQVLGSYQLLEELGRGGMGEVFRAERIDGEFQQTVAIKTMSVSAQGQEDRFLRERQVLARLQHPNIAQLLDGGTTDDGAPYLVMELVRGRTLTEFCDERKLAVDERLDLFRQVLGAVEYAHRNLVIHRDIKPSNVLVSEAAEVKLLDFGIARIVVDDNSAEETRLVHMTPEYAAPEMLLGEVPTAAADIYSLGVLLFELLAGARPFARAQSSLELQMQILETDAPRLTAAIVRQSEEQRLETTRNRGLRWPSLRRTLRGDLEAIVAKCLRKEPGARYQSVSALSDDLDRLQTGQPVRAVEGSLRYAAGKAVRRHWLPLSALAFVITSLVLGLAITLDRERKARAAEAKAGAINRFLTDELLGSARPEIALGRDLRVAEVVTNAELSLDALSEEPEVELALRRTLASVRRSLGETEKAQEHVDAALRIEGAVGPLERVRLELERVRLLPPRDAVEPLRAAAGRLEELLDPLAPEVLRTQIELGSLLSSAGRTDAALDVLQRAVELTATSALGSSRNTLTPLHAEALAALARLQDERNLRLEALQLYERALEIQERLLGPEHPKVATILRSMVGYYSSEGRAAEAEEAGRRALEIRRAVYGDNHPETLYTLYSLALAHYRARHDDFESTALDLQVRSTGLAEDHPLRPRADQMAAVALRRSGKLDEAAVFYRKAAESAERAYGPGHTAHMLHLRNHAWFFARTDQPIEALRISARLRELASEALADEEQDAMYFADQASFFGRSGPEDALDQNFALRLAREAVRRSTEPTYYPLTIMSSIEYRLGNLEAAIDAQEQAMSLDDTIALLGEQMKFVELALEGDQPERVERYARSYRERVQRHRATNDPLLVFSRLPEVDLHRHRGEFTQAETVALGILRDASGALPERHPYFSLTHLALAETLVEAERLDEARRELRWVVDADANGHHVRAAEQLLSQIELP